ncbi:hypothetical protein NDU88_003649 [Pleurodeles waltl]|uniref:Uncharacterized protein n=1 Tax=Pleurodeles waltl TaxID=8319 RepID=A0AAV7T6Q5_PLEWA|nr:hypothetical protein NDU88_003649 [Pleurodeles waltl]
MLQPKRVGVHSFMSVVVREGAASLSRSLCCHGPAVQLSAPRQWTVRRQGRQRWTRSQEESPESPEHPKNKACTAPERSDTVEKRWADTGSGTTAKHPGGGWRQSHQGSRSHETEVRV